MKKEHLKALGIEVSRDLTTRELLCLGNDEIFNEKTATKIAALREICDELYCADISRKQTISCSLDASIIIKPKLQYLDHEQCWIMTLNSNNSVIGIHNVGSGTLNSCIFDIRRIVRTCLIDNCAGVLLAHNHPSGNSKPSKSDIDQTIRLKKALDMFNIGLVDHLVITDDKFYSFVDENVSLLK